MGRLTLKRTIQRRPDKTKGPITIDAVEIDDVHILHGLGHRLRVSDKLPIKEQERLKKELLRADREECYFRAFAWTLTGIAALLVVGFLYLAVWAYVAMGNPDG